MTALVVLGLLGLVLFGWVAAAGLVAGAAILNSEWADPAGTVAGYAALALLYVWVCWRWPVVDCRLCGGKTKKRPPVWLRGFAKAFRHGCLLCGGAGRYTRFGRRMLLWLDGS